MARLGCGVLKSLERTPSKATPKGASSDGGWLAPVPGTEQLHAAGRRAARISAHSRPTGKAPRQAPNLLHCGLGERLAGVTTLPSLGQLQESGSIKSPKRSEPAQTSRQGAPEREVFQSVFPRGSGTRPDLVAPATCTPAKRDTPRQSRRCPESGSGHPPRSRCPAAATAGRGRRGCARFCADHLALLAGRSGRIEGNRWPHG